MKYLKHLKNLNIIIKISCKDLDSASRLNRQHSVHFMVLSSSLQGRLALCTHEGMSQVRSLKLQSGYEEESHSTTTVTMHLLPQIDCGP